MSKKITLELSEVEVKVVASALKYTKAYKGTKKCLTPSSTNSKTMDFVR